MYFFANFILTIKTKGLYLQTNCVSKYPISFSNKVLNSTNGEIPNFIINYSQNYEELY